MYYIHNGTEQEGPFQLNDLKIKKISKETPIWFEGLSDWTTAGEINELKDLFIVTPPPFKKTESLASNVPIPHLDNTKKKDNVSIPKEVVSNSEIISSKKSYPLKSILAGGGLVFLIIFLIIYNVTQNKLRRAEEEKQKVAIELQKAEQENQRVILDQKRLDEERQRMLAAENTPERLREKLIAKEMQSPIEYLQTGNETFEEHKVLTRAPSFWNHSEYAVDGYLLKGYIINNATIATFKDIVINVSYFTETKTFISKEEFTITKYARPQSSFQFEKLCHPPQGFAQWSAKIKGATAN